MLCMQQTWLPAVGLAAALMLPAPPCSAGSVAPTPPLPGCITRLAALGIKAEPHAAIPAPPFAACVIAEPVTLISAAPKTGEPIQFPDHPLLSCAMAERLAQFSVDAASPMALSAFGKPLASVSTGPGYECRPRNRVAGAKISSHGQGNAADIVVLELAGGRKISIEKPGDLVTVKFLTQLRTAACAAFNTVLGPGSDPSHAGHIHIDIAPRGKKGNAKFCQ
jgi:hypothetical protein